MRGIWCQAEMNGIPVSHQPITGMSHMVFDISVKPIGTNHFALELHKNILVRLTKDICQYIQSSTMGHTDNKLFHSKHCPLLNKGVQCRNNRLRPLQ